MSYSVGIDFGTSGARLIAINPEGQVQFETAIAFASQAAATHPLVWKQTLFDLLSAIPTHLKSSVRRIAIDGTSSTILLCDLVGNPLIPPKMYCDRGSPEVLASLKPLAPGEHIVLSLSSSLCKYLSWFEPEHSQFKLDQGILLHQADWLAAQLHGQWGISDYHNCLKLGFDPQELAYPDWFSTRLDVTKLPQPLQPGASIDRIQSSVGVQLDLPAQVEICAGTTDSIAAFLASGARELGDAVTSLGSTIALKLLSEVRVESATFGVYSHWFGDHWLVGGASNAGGAVLAQFFSPTELQELSPHIDWSHSEIPVYMPLLKPGERFPVNDPELAPCLEPKPENPVIFLQALLVSLARIEQTGYEKLQALGASPLKRLITSGGGANNPDWMEWRQHILGVPVSKSPQPAAYGSAKLASASYFAAS